MTTTEPEREKSLQDYRKKLLEHKEVESRLKESKFFSFLNTISLGRWLTILLMQCESTE